MGSFVQLFDELGIEILDNHVLERPLWSLANIEASQFKGLPVTFSISEQLVDIRKQMIGEKNFNFLPVPEEVQGKASSLSAGRRQLARKAPFDVSERNFSR